MRFMVATASTGYCPAADSADSIMASAPSKIAIETSDTSARVGTGLEIMDSSIWVATTTGLPARRADAGHLLLQPRHLLERHLDPEVAARHHQCIGELQDLAEPMHGLRLLDLGHDGGAAARDLLRLGDVFRALDEGERHPVDAGVERSIEIGAVLLRQRRERHRRVGKAYAFAVRNLPPTSTRVTMRLWSTSVATSLILPSSSKSVWPGSMAAKISGCGRCARVASPGAGSSSRTKISPLVSVAGPAAKLPTLSLGP